ncbi:MAG TPA: flagellar protein FlgN [Clostridiaceae bacterium]|nr:flagellar protein FlgN [Clostridiaceae bacterium]
MQEVDSLVEVLKQQSDIYDYLLAKSKEKTDIIVNGKVDELDKITKLEKTLLSDIAKLERERETLVNKIAGEIGISPEQATMSELIRRLDKNETGKLEVLRKRVSEVLKELKRINELNSILIKNSLEYAEFSLNILSAARVTDNNYGNSGKVSGSKNRSFFDVKL